MIRAGIAGLGRWGQRLVSSVEEPNPSSKIKFVRAMTRSPEKVTEFAKMHGLPVDSDFEALLTDTEVDAVVLATPHSQHVTQIKQAAAAGKHIFVEKPLALDFRSAHEAAEACARAGVKLAVGFNRRFLPAFQRLDAELKSGALGQALHTEGGFSGPFGFAYREGMWRGSRAENPAGGMAAMGVHVLDAMIHLMGPVADVRAISRRQVLDIDMDDTTSVVLQFQSGQTGYLSTIMATAQFWRLQVFGSKSWVVMRDQTILDFREVDGDVHSEKFEPIDTERAELEAFAEDILLDSSFPVDIPTALHVVSVMEAIGRSAESNGETTPVERSIEECVIPTRSV